MTTFDYVLLTERVKRSCLERAERGLRKWAEDWGTLPVFSATCLPACEFEQVSAQQTPWQRIDLPNDSVAWRRTGTDLGRAIARQLFNLDSGIATMERGASGLADAVCTGAGDALFRALLKAITGSEVQADRSPEGMPPPEHFKRGAGSVVIRLDFGGACMELLLPKAALPGAPVAQYGSARTHCNPRDAVQALRIRLQVVVGHAELTLGSLQGLAVGDIVPLGSRVDRPVTVMAPGGRKACMAQLGNFAGMRAIVIEKRS